jgi:hypothetical protein
MFAAPLTFGERATHAAANAMAFGFTVLGVNALAPWSPHVALVGVLAVTAGLCLGGLSLITLDLIEIGNPRIRGLTLLGALAYLFALWACPLAVLAGGASLAFLCWLAYMVAESAVQAIRIRAYFAYTRHAPVIAQTAQITIDAVSFAVASLALLPVLGPGPASTRLWVTLAVLIPLVVLRALRRRGQTLPAQAIVLSAPRPYVRRTASLRHRALRRRPDR